MYNRQAQDLQAHIRDVETELDAYIDEQASGTTGLGPIIEEGNVILSSLNNSLARTQAKAAARRRPPDELQRAYQHIADYFDIAGHTHPPPHPRDPLLMTKLQMVESIVEDYGVPPGDIANMPDAYPLQVLV